MGLFLPGIGPHEVPGTKSETLEALDDEKAMLTGPDRVVAGSGSGPKTSAQAPTPSSAWQDVREPPSDGGLRAPPPWPVTSLPPWWTLRLELSLNRLASLSR